MDLYRLKNLDEALDLGITEYLDSGNICLIEWPELIEDLVERPHLEVNIHFLDRQTRQYRITKHD